MIIDKSGSMSHMKHAVIDSVNKFINDQKEAPGTATFTLVEFNDEVSTSYNAVDLKSVLPFSDYYPNGMTAMNDAIGRTIYLVGKRLAEMDEKDRPSKVVLAIQTDGCENASKEYTTKQVKEMVKEQTDKYSWEFVFLGTNLDAVKTAVDIGIKKENSMFYQNTVFGATSGFESLSENLVSYRCGAKSTMAYEEKDFSAQGLQ